MRPIVKRVITYAREFGLTMIEGDYEDNGQVELNFEYDNCELTCDRLVTYRQICAQVADEFGVTASFMPKPSETAMANGCHHNLSLWSAGENVFIDPANPQMHLTEVARHALGGTALQLPVDAGISCSHRKLICSLLARGGVRAGAGQLGVRQPHMRCSRIGIRPSRVQASRRQREPVSLPRPHSRGDGRRDRKRDRPGAPESGSSYTAAVGPSGDAVPGFASLPKTLGDALSAVRDGPIPRDWLGQELLDTYVELKAAEWEEFCAAVTDWHRDRYLRAIP